MPRAPETPWNSPTFVPARPERLPEADRPLVCGCPDYPCTEATCLRQSFSDADRCAACEKHGRALFTRAEERYVKNGGGLPKGTVEALGLLAGTHDGHSSRLLRETGIKYGTGGELADPVAEAC